MYTRYTVQVHKRGNGDLTWTYVIYENELLKFLDRYPKDDYIFTIAK